MAKGDRAGNTLRTAKNLGRLGTQPVTTRDRVSAADLDDLYRFRVIRSSQLELQLSGLKTGVSVQVFTAKSKTKRPQTIWQSPFSSLKPSDLRKHFKFVMKTSVSSSSGDRAQASPPLDLDLKSGEYYLRLRYSKGDTSYRVRLSAQQNISLPGSAPGSSTPAETAAPAPPVALNLAWVKQFGTTANDFAYGVATSGDSVDVSGATEGDLGTVNLGDRDSYASRFSSSGIAQWQRQFGTSGYDNAFDVATDASGNYYLAGVEDASGINPDGYIAKYSSDGRQLWRNTLSTTVSFGFGFPLNAADSASGITVDSAGNVYVSGLVRGIPGPSPSRAYVAKYSASGEKLWSQEFGTARSSAASAVAVDAQGNVYVSGITNAILTSNRADPFQEGDAFVAKFSATGSQLWNQTLSSTAKDYARSIAVDRSGNVYITGDTDGTLGQSSFGGRDGFLAKYSSSGVQQWVQQYGTAGVDESQGIAVDRYDRLYVTGETAGSLFGGTYAGGSDAWVASFATSGSRLKSVQLGTAQDDEAYGITVNDAGVVYLVGQTQGSFANATNQGGFDAWVAKFT